MMWTASLLDPDTVTSVTFAADSHLVLAGTHRRGLRAWRVADASALPRRRSGSAIWGLTSTPSGAWLAASLDAGVVALWSAAERPFGRSLASPTPVARDRLAFSADGALLAAWGRATPLVVWRVADGAGQVLTDPSVHSVSTTAFAPPPLLLATVSRFGEVRCWSPATGTWTSLGRSPTVEPPPEADPPVLTWSPDGAVLAVSYWDGQVRLHRRDGRAQAHLRGHWGGHHRAGLHP